MNSATPERISVLAISSDALIREVITDDFAAVGDKVTFCPVPSYADVFLRKARYDAVVAINSGLPKDLDYRIVAIDLDFNHPGLTVEGKIMRSSFDKLPELVEMTHLMVNRVRNGLSVTLHSPSR